MFNYTLFEIITIENLLEIVKKCQSGRIFQKLSEQDRSLCTQTNTDIRVKSIYKLISDQKLSPTDVIESLPCSIFSHKNVKSSDGKCFKVRTRTNVKNCHRCLALFNIKFRFVIKVNRDFDWVFYLITITEFAQGNQRAIPSRLLTKRSAYASENLFQDEKTSSH